ncbi:SusD family outer membrane lipoprotein NanU [Chitinophaga sp. MM2321]|uniref:SusD family outer membrane lipoprotein NanU n=1 Tax=Chitinophaga sp. MM2321 TaxID=3137178 RepID=UPI0032D57A52
MKRNILIITGSWILLLVSGCAKNLDLVPVSSISNASYWKTSDQVDAFVTGVHARFRTDNGVFQFLGEMRSDVFGTEPGIGATFTGESSQGLEVMWSQTLDPSFPGVSNFGNLYFNIDQLNLLINKLSATDDLVSASFKNYYLGEAYGMRAFYYFQLLRSWGKVVIQTDPVISITDVSGLAKAPSSEADVITLIKSDIDNSVNSFGTDYSFKNNKSFWSKAATLMLKGEVYLWTSARGGGSADATVAKTALTDIETNVPALTLLPNFTDVFSVKGNGEIIFASRYQLNEATIAFIPSSFVPQTSLISNFYDSAQNRKMNDGIKDNWGGLLRAPVLISTFRQFDDKDSRKLATIQPGYSIDISKRPTADTMVIKGAFVKKFSGENNAGSRQYTNDYPIYRYADLLLLLAEAKVILGEDPAGEINQVRQRAFGANYDVAIQGYPNQAIDANSKEAILKERLLEFIFEGKRWYDLRRMGDTFVYNHIPVSQFANSDPAGRLLWPVDQTSLTNNRLLEQNPGYR